MTNKNNILKFIEYIDSLDKDIIKCEICNTFDLCSPNESKEKFSKLFKNVNDKCLMQFRKTLNELLETCNDDLTKEERTFLEFFKKKIPLGVAGCMVNRICWKIEEEFDGKLEPYDTKDKFAKIDPQQPEEYIFLIVLPEYYAKTYISLWHQILSSHNICLFHNQQPSLLTMNLQPFDRNNLFLV